MTFGLRGTKYVLSLLRTIAPAYWFAFQTGAGSIAVVAVLRHWTGTTYSLVTVSLICGFVQAVVAVVGYDSLKFLSRAALPFKIPVRGYIVVLQMAHDDPNFAPSAVLAYAPCRRPTGCCSSPGATPSRLAPSLWSPMPRIFVAAHGTAPTWGGALL
jgi:hypothetical protein